MFRFLRFCWMYCASIGVASICATCCLFPHLSDPSRPADPTGVQKYLQRMVAKAGLSKKVTPKTLRHCYATHLIEQGTSTRVVQVLLGHANVHTTETYTHVSPATLGNVTGPLERVLKAATKSSRE